VYVRVRRLVVESTVVTCYIVHGGDPGTVTGEVVEKASSGYNPDGYYSQAEPDLINEVGHSVLAVGFTYGCT